MTNKTFGFRALPALIGLLIGFGCFLTSTAALAGDRGNIRSRLIPPDSGETQIITLDGGSEIMGRVVSAGEDSIVFESEIGTTTIPIHKVTGIKTISRVSVRRGKIWFPNPNETRLFFSPTARLLKKGEGYFADYYIFFPSVAVGLTDNITIGGGLSIFPGLSFDEQAYFLTPKAGVAISDYFSLAVGALIIHLPGSFGDDFLNEDLPEFGIIYGVSTWGRPDASVSAGLGFGFAGGDVSDQPVFILGGEKRFLRGLSFVSENWVVPGADHPVVSYGLRFFGEKISVDLAFFNTLGGGIIFPGVPYIDFVVAF